MDFPDTLPAQAPAAPLTPDAATSASNAAGWPDHLVPPGPCGWTWWRDAVLRSAGFPAALLTQLSSPGLAAAAQAANEAEQRLRARVEQGENEVRTLIAHLRQGEKELDKPALRALGRAQKTLKLLREGKADQDGCPIVPAPQELGPELCAAIDAAAAEYRCTLADMDAAYEQALQSLEGATAGFARDPLFRSAVGWQNLDAVSTVLDPLAQGHAMGGSKRRQREALVANYVQRYGVKNDSIGFFGPLAWIRIDDDARNATYQAGKGLVSSRSVHFEDWAIAALAEKYAQDERYMPYLIAGMEPYLRLEGQTLCLPGGGSVALDEAEARVLSMCNGSAQCKTLCRALLADPFSPFADEAQIYALLRQLNARHRIWLSFQIPSCGDDPDLALHQHLQRIDDATLRAEALAALESLQQAKDAVLAAAGDPDALAQAMHALHQVFASVVGGPSRRKQGEVYGGRALVYEDCHRDLQLTLSREALAPATDALELVLTSARWFTSAAWGRFKRAFDLEFDRLQTQARGTDSLRLADLWPHLQSIVFGDQVPLDDLAQELRDRWESLLLDGAGSTPSRIAFELHELRAKVLETFATDGSVWMLGRYHCPDLMFCASSPQALAQGDYLAVLGEVHIGGNTVATNLFASQHPERQRLLDALCSDLGDNYVMPKLSPHASGTPTRTQWVDDPERALEVVFSRGFVPANAATARSIASLQVFREAGELQVRDRRWQAPLRDVLGDFLFIAVINRFGMMHKREHTPRVTLGQLVVQRETWSFQAGELDFALLEDERAAFRAAQAWRSRLGVPAQVFAKFAWEAKPVYLDFDSLVSVRMLAKQLRRGMDEASGAGGRLSFSEMLPGPDELWLHDAEGLRYTSEFRLVGLHADDLLARQDGRSR
ncbi:lantibiotic dehydratase [Roseateles sp. DB2]|uniref:lantibiotic dehydratase n=1 Tax=Roseateles sp. DB2 TaxID=3453717 RepID=UPI003EE82A5C